MRAKTTDERESKKISLKVGILSEFVSTQASFHIVF
jgi:hypothetical protein